MRPRPSKIKGAKAVAPLSSISWSASSRIESTRAWAAAASTIPIDADLRQHRSHGDRQYRVRSSRTDEYGRCVKRRVAPHPGQSQLEWPRRDPEICDRSEHGELRDGVMEHARHPQALIGNPPPPNIRGAPKGAPPKSSAPLSSPELTGPRAHSTLIGRAREPMSFWDTEWRQGSYHDPR
jgi:hypothetical protein